MRLFLLFILVGTLALCDWQNPAPVPVQANPMDQQALSVCEALSQLGELRGKLITVTGTWGGTYYHGYFLQGRPRLQPCEDSWFTARSGILLNLSGVRTALAQSKPREGDLVTITGLLETKRLLLILHSGPEQYIGNGYGDGLFAATMLLRSIAITKRQYQ